MPPAPLIRVGLASQSPAADYAAIQRVAAALHIQVQRDLGPLWSIDATVEPVQDPTRIPAGMLPIFVVDDTPNHVGGLHTDNDGHAFAVVLASRDWGLGASHECIEMLIDPTGSRLQTGIGLQITTQGIQDGPVRVQYLVEACDPMEDPAHAYMIGDVLVSDFYTPAYFDDAPTPGARYSQNGSITRPRQVNLNGYLSWVHPILGHMQQLRWFEQGPVLHDLPDHSQATQQDGLSLRQFVDRNTITPRHRRPPGTSKT